MLTGGSSKSSRWLPKRLNTSRAISLSQSLVLSRIKPLTRCPSVGKEIKLKMLKCLTSRLCNDCIWLFIVHEPCDFSAFVMQGGWSGSAKSRGNSRQESYSRGHQPCVRSGSEAGRLRCGTQSWYLSHKWIFKMGLIMFWKNRCPCVVLCWL